MRIAAAVMVLAFVYGARAQDNPNARPPVSKLDVEIVRRAKEILNSPAKWNRADNRGCPEKATTFSLYCALEKATAEKSGSFEHRGAAMQEARFVIEDVARDVSRYQHRLMDYNNDPTTTFEDIQKVFRLLEERVAKRLAAGPQDATAPPKPLPAPASTAPAAPRPVTPADLVVLQHVRALLNSPEKWDRKDRQQCDEAARTISLFCAFQIAAKQVNGAFDNSAAAIEEARTMISELDPNRTKYMARLTDYNNDPQVSFHDMQRLLQNVEDRLKKRMPAK